MAIVSKPLRKASITAVHEPGLLPTAQPLSMSPPHCSLRSALLAFLLLPGLPMTPHTSGKLNYKVLPAEVHTAHSFLSLRAQL